MYAHRKNSALKQHKRASKYRPTMYQTETRVSKPFFLFRDSSVVGAEATHPRLSCVNTPRRCPRNKMCGPCSRPHSSPETIRAAQLRAHAKQLVVATTPKSVRGIKCSVLTEGEARSQNRGLVPTANKSIIPFWPAHTQLFGNNSSCAHSHQSEVGTHFARPPSTN